MLLPTFYLNLYQPLPAVVPYDLESLRVDGIAINPRVTSLEFSSALPGGWNGLRAGFLPAFAAEADPEWRTSWLDRPVWSRPRGHIELVTGQGGLIWRGRRTTPSSKAGRLDGIEAAGYGVAATNDSPLLNPPNLTTTSQGALRYALQSAVPPFAIGNVSQFQDPGVAHSLSEFENLTAAQVMDQLTKEGGSGAGAAFDFMVYETASFLPRVAPAVPDYCIPWDSTVTDKENDSELYGTVYVDYTDLVGTARTTSWTDPTFVSRFGFSASKRIPAGVLSPAAAAEFARTMVALHSVIWKSLTVTRGLERGLEIMAGGAERGGFYARAGEWVQVGADPADTYIVQHTNYQGFGGLQMDLGQPANGWPELLDGLITTSGHVKRGTNPNSGSRAA